MNWKNLALALFGALGRLVVPLLIRQTIDRGFRDGRVQLGYVVTLCGLSCAGLLATSWSTRSAIVRLGTTSERGLAVLRERIVRRILDLSLQQHGEQRRVGVADGGVAGFQGRLALPAPRRSAVGR